MSEYTYDNEFMIGIMWTGLQTRQAAYVCGYRHNLCNFRQRKVHYNIQGMIH